MCYTVVITNYEIFLIIQRGGMTDEINDHSKKNANLP